MDTTCIRATCIGCKRGITLLSRYAVEIQQETTHVGLLFYNVSYVDEALPTGGLIMRRNCSPPVCPSVRPSVPSEIVTQE